VSATSASSIIINDCFSVNYSNYKILSTLIGSQQTNLNVRLRVSGSDNSSTIYSNQNLAASATTVSAVRNTGSTSFIALLGSVSSTENNFKICEIQNPFLTGFTTAWNSTSSATSGALTLNVNSFGTNITDSFTGISVLPAAGTITGSVSVYGYKE
jgi:hypothetical protein